MNKKQKQQAKEIFEANPNIAKLYINPKGEFFTNKNYGENSLGLKEELKVVTRDLVSEPVEEALSVEELIEQIQGEKSVSVLEQQLIDEQAGANRTDVLDAVIARLETLKSSENGKS